MQNKNLLSIHIFYRLLTEIKKLLSRHDQLKKEENSFKDKCRNNLKELQQNIE